MVRGSAEIYAAGDYCRDSDWDALKAFSDGFTPSGTFRAPYTFLIDFDGTDFYASNVFQTVYGGASDTGGIDGADGGAVLQAAIDDTTAGDIICFNTATIPISTKQIGAGDLAGINYGLKFKEGISLVSLNRFGTVIQRDFAYDATANFIESRGMSNITLDGLTFDLDHIDNGVQFGRAEHIAGTPMSDNITIENCRFINSGFWGIAFTMSDVGQASDNLRFINNYIHGSSTNVAHGDTTCFNNKNSLIQGNTFTNIYNSWACPVYEADNVSVRDNIFNCFANTVELALASSRYCTVEGNHFCGTELRWSMFASC
jgi:hypothetical protein